MIPGETQLIFSNSRNIRSVIWRLYLKVLMQIWKSPYQAFIQALSSKTIFPVKFSFFTVCFFQWLCGVAPWWAPNGKFLKFRSPNHLKMYFSWNFRVLWVISKKIWLEIYTQLSFMRVCKYLNQRVRRIGESNRKSFKGFSKKTKNMKRLSFVAQFKI